MLLGSKNDRATSSAGVPNSKKLRSKTRHRDVNIVQGDINRVLPFYLVKLGPYHLCRKGSRMFMSNIELTHECTLPRPQDDCDTGV